MIKDLESVAEYQESMAATERQRSQSHGGGGSHSRHSGSGVMNSSSSSGGDDMIGTFSSELMTHTFFVRDSSFESIRTNMYERSPSTIPTHMSDDTWNRRVPDDDDDRRDDAVNVDGGGMMGPGNEDVSDDAKKINDGESDTPVTEGSSDMGSGSLAALVKNTVLNLLPVQR